MFIILAGLFVFMCFPQNQSRVTARDGVLDLHGIKDNVPLHGEWEFIYGELLMPADFADRHAEKIIVPSSWDEYGYPLNGCATYRLTVLTDRQEPHMLFLPRVSSAYILWVNDELVRSAGTVSDDPAVSRMNFENAILPVAAENGVIELVFQVSNHQEVAGGLTGSLLLGGIETIQSWFVRTRVFSAVALGCILMTAFYHLTLYIYRRREKAYLIFALLCAVCFARFLLETNGLIYYFPQVPFNMTALTVSKALFFVHSILILTFSLYIFSHGFLRKHKAVLFAFFVLMFLTGTFIPSNIEWYYLFMSVISIPFSVFVAVMIARSPVLRENGTMRLYFAAFLAYIIVGPVTKLFLDNTLYMTGLITNMFMIMAQSMVLSRRYTDAFRFVEETNENLEKIVDERTHSLQAANEAMQITNNAMKELVSNISHDLKTPLSVMSVNLESLSSLAVTQSDADYQRHVRAAYQKNLDLQRLIGNLFEVSRIETGRNLYAPKWESLLRLLAQVNEKYNDYLEDHGLTLEIDAPHNMEVSTDPQKIWSVFDNIIYNAVRHTEPGGSITVNSQLSTENSQLSIRITDTGSGIGSEHLPRIFERFYKGSQARNANEGESGLGLYIVKSIMDGCGGGAEIESEPAGDGRRGKGTSVILTFPVREAENNC
jgi:signal transduction histidine kinase